MPNQISKSAFKPKALHYFRTVEQTGQELIITDHGLPVLKIVPFEEDQTSSLDFLRGSVIEYQEPLEPVGLEDWESLQ